MKLKFFILLFILLIPFAVSAEEPIKLKPNQIMLIDETPSPGHHYFIRTIQLPSGEITYITIDYPEEWQNDINNSKDSVLEAKKKLAGAYLSLNLKDRYTEVVNGVSSFDKETEMVISPKYLDKFKKDKLQVLSYAQQKKSEFDAMSEEQRKNLYKTQSLEYFKSYEQLIKETKEVEADQTAWMRAIDDEIKKEQEAKKEKENNPIVSFFTSQLFLLIVSSLIILAIVVFTLRKRR